MTDRASAEGLRAAIDAALHELGEPGPGYPAPVANAVDILRAALRDTIMTDLAAAEAERARIRAAVEGLPRYPMWMDQSKWDGIRYGRLIDLPAVLAAIDEAAE